MRTYVLVALVMVIVLATGLFALEALKDTAARMVAGFDRVEKAVAGEDWAEARREMDRAQKMWTGYKGWWTMVIDHQEIDNIDMTMARMNRYIGMRDKTMAFGELAVLKQILCHIPEKEKVSWQNIL